MFQTITSFFKWLFSVGSEKSTIIVSPVEREESKTIVSDAGKVLVTEDNKVIVSSPTIPAMQLQIKKVSFPDNQYYKVVTPKKQIVLHHTVSSPNSPQLVVSGWAATDERVATAYVQAGDGSFLQVFDDTYWCHSLGIRANFLASKGFKDSGTRNTILNQNAVSVEVCAWGGLTLGDGTTKTINGKQILTKKDAFYNAYGNVIDASLGVEEIAWRGFKYFQKYTDAQVEGLGLLLSGIMKRYGIKSAGIKDGNFDIRMDALSGDSGIFTHTNYRTDKSDLYPDKRIIQMLNNL